MTEQEKRHNTPPVNSRYVRKFGGGSKYDAQPDWTLDPYTVLARARITEVNLFLDGLDLAAEAEAFLAGELS